VLGTDGLLHIWFPLDLLKPSPTLHSVYRRGSDTAYLLLYVDDMSLQLPHPVYFDVLF
jgi:hypothetical protein